MKKMTIILLLTAAVSAFAIFIAVKNNILGNKNRTLIFCIDEIVQKPGTKTLTIKFRFKDTGKNTCVRVFHSPDENSYIIKGETSSRTEVQTSVVDQPFVKGPKISFTCSLTGGSSGIGPIDSQDMDNIDDWLLIETGKEYFILEGEKLAAWKVENPDGSISTVFVSNDGACPDEAGMAAGSEVK